MLSLVLLYEGYTNRPSGQSLDQTIILTSSFKAPLYAQKTKQNKPKNKKKLLPRSFVAKQSRGRQVKSPPFAPRDAVFGKPMLILT